MKAEDANCPACGNQTLRIEMRLVSKPLGSFSIAGAQLKTVGYEWPHLVCDTCGIVAAAKGAD